MVKVKWRENRSVVSDSLGPHGLYNPWNSPGQNTGVGSLSLLQGIFPTQGSNPGSPILQVDSLPAEPQREACFRAREEAFAHLCFKWEIALKFQISCFPQAIWCHSHKETISWKEQQTLGWALSPAAHQSCSPSLCVTCLIPEVISSCDH